ncbi:MAG: hypothetical protein LBD48_05095 [Treponema sp.]|nr:hypothetical protein [Treponema sp.]
MELHRISWYRDFGTVCIDLPHSLTGALEIQKNVSGGTILTHRGENTYTVQIGTPPAAQVVSATTGPASGYDASLDAPYGTTAAVEFDDDISATDAKAGVSISRSGANLTITNGTISGKILTLTVTEHIVQSDSLTITYNAAAGNLTNNGATIAAFTQAITNTLPVKVGTPYLKHIHVGEGTEPSSVDTNKLRVFFAEPVTIASGDYGKWTVYVTGGPTYSSTTTAMTEPYVDITRGRRTLTVSSATAAAGTNDTEWVLTLNDNIKYGEMVLAATTAGAAQDKAASPNSLPAVKRFIVRNLIKRTKDACETTPGFYKNGAVVSGFESLGSDTQLLHKVMQWFKTGSPTSTTGGTTSNGIRSSVNGDKYTIVLGGNQTYSNSGLGYGTADGLPASASADKVITVVLTTAGNDVTVTFTGGGNINARNQLTWIHDEHVIFTAGSSYANNYYALMDGGRLIMDGGELKDAHASTTNNISGAILAGGGSSGAWIIINGGKIYNNTAAITGDSDATYNNTSMVSSGGIIFTDTALLIMNGGEIYNNTASGAVESARGGAITISNLSNNSSAHRIRRGAVFITGGVIRNNTVTTGAAAGAGGVFVSCLFQKTGGWIYGADGGANAPTVTGTGNAKAGAVIHSFNHFAANNTAWNPATSAVKMRNNTSAPDDLLIIDQAGTADTREVPGWAGPSNWD